MGAGGEVVDFLGRGGRGSVVEAGQRGQLPAVCASNTKVQEQSREDLLQQYVVDLGGGSTIYEYSHSAFLLWKLLYLLFSVSWQRC